jgi:hypothetical protein
MRGKNEWIRRKSRLPKTDSNWDAGSQEGVAERGRSAKPECDAELRIYVILPGGVPVAHRPGGTLY